MSTPNNEQRKRIIDDIMQGHALGRETLGTSIRRLRLEVTGFDQATFATMCNLSTKALYQIETDKGNPTLGTIETILRKFGLRLGLAAGIPASSVSLSEPQSDVARPARGANPRRKHVEQRAGATAAPLDKGGERR
ncbi:helix-turn-helix domain-containing protein [Pseudomonas sp. YJ42]|uniref:helix-turn-helix domain-containing protein n=1 Tax=Pseudomonas sp. YJ42 TaxID=3392115 RepID=UPI0039A23D92